MCDHCGSSPPVRGTPLVATIDETDLPVHPRLCGEHECHCRLTPSSFGSSPPVRGTLEKIQRSRFFGRFIPACAGNTLRSEAACSLPFPVHPRLCGEHLRFIRGPLRATTGSSPPVRGTHGSPPGSICWTPYGSVHPRLCGEHAIREASCRPDPGGPVHPRLCGEHAVNLPGDWLASRATVHPRLCGEHPRIPRRRHVPSRFIPACAGNTVHTRLRKRRQPVHPACAGNTSAPRFRYRSKAVHPRLCGEHSSHKILKNKDFRDQQMRTSFSSYVLHVDEGFQTCLSARLGGCLIDNSWQGRKTHELETVEIDGNAAIDTTGVEVITRVAGHSPSDNGVAVADVSLDLFPNHLARPAGVIAT